MYGAVFGVFTLTWAFSGLLSMGPFPVMDRLTALVVPVDEVAGEIQTCWIVEPAVALIGQH